MRILLVSQHFWPESFIINDLVSTLVSQGHQVKVVTGKPNYPDGEIYPGYTQSGIVNEVYEDSIQVSRVPLRPRYNGGALNLVFNYLSFVFSGLVYFPRLVKGQKFDVVFVFANSPITQAIPAIYLKWRLKAHLAVWVQDLWPESLSATGFIRNKFILKLVGYMVKGIYAFSDTLLVQSKAFFEPVSRYANKKKIVYYPNSILVNKPRVSAELSDELITTLKNNFCVVFAGNIGKAQSIETILNAAHKLKEEKQIKFVIVGSGSMLDWSQSQKEMLGLSNVFFAGRYPVDMMPAIYQHASALLVTLKDEEIFSKTIPSKVQSYMAAKRPIIASLNGEGARVIKESGAGLSCNAEDSDALAQRVRGLYEMSENERSNMGEAGYAYFLKEFEMNHQAQRLIEILEQRISETRRNN